MNYRNKFNEVSARNQNEAKEITASTIHNSLKENMTHNVTKKCLFYTIESF